LNIVAAEPRASTNAGRVPSTRGEDSIAKTGTNGILISQSIWCAIDVPDFDRALHLNSAGEFRADQRREDGCKGEEENGEKFRSLWFDEVPRGEGKIANVFFVPGLILMVA